MCFSTELWNRRLIIKFELLYLNLLFNLGRGALFILEEFNDDIRCLKLFNWPNDGLFDICWSELNEHIVWSCSGDGQIQIWNISSPNLEPVNVVKAHVREIYSCEWSQVRHDPAAVVTASWDHSVKLWDANTAVLINEFSAHENIVYSANWSPLLSCTFASTSADSTLRIWSSRDCTKPVVEIKASNLEVLTCDWCKYNENVIATGSTDGIIHGWDIRSPVMPLFSLMGHSKTIKKVKFSPFKETVLASVSYDFTTRIWDSHLITQCSSPQLIVMQNHKEFAYGLDFNLNIPNQLADCGWDQLVNIFSVNQLN